MSVQIEQNNEKHYCRVPGCHKVYSESEFLLAHLQWHKNQPPTTTPFCPPEGPTPKPVSPNLDLKALAATVQLGQILEQIDQTNEKHYCRVPSCHKVYSESSHLKAHLQWHINESVEKSDEIICKIEDI
uniref:C2H2-type domain-containing protein n=1 Tax=Meloidogyne enterolobii TaxID=390850 RepID=A0A6V7TSI5_MELEN|nr:unnamed protein product [Meloidogyne enterolobii]